MSRHVYCELLQKDATSFAVAAEKAMLDQWLGGLESVPPRLHHPLLIETKKAPPGAFFFAYWTQSAAGPRIATSRGTPHAADD
ncbi:hypothetical protein LZ016_01795 [Sphingomonas sp. SM33]|uniref:Uncharacterized protein n=1 Tax=Sphingomonas telluris TaxID=2907998 RepID=A0ABS9VIQ7_9SPHN|nr:hypothetical protein [Sphingomonas telluris]MCH8614840.1 hypothetical protein [Sphingomonas telluris]